MKWQISTRLLVRQSTAFPHGSLSALRNNAGGKSHLKGAK